MHAAFIFICYFRQTCHKNGLKHGRYQDYCGVISKYGTY